MQWTQNKFTKALGISTIIVLGMILIVFGAISHFVKGSDPAAPPALRLAFAIVIVIGSVFFGVQGADWNRITFTSVSYLRRLI